MSLLPAEQLPCVLAIDDSELIHKILRIHLRHERLDLRSAFSGAEGLLLARELKPAIILLDIQLGDMDGFEVLARLKDDPETRSIAVIFISGFSEPVDRVRGLDLGAVDFITKPFEVIELTARVRSTLRLQQAMRILSVKAQIDGLTGLWNRAYFDKRLVAEFSESRRHSQPCSLIMADIDEFKLINDGYGHPFGDAVLERFARILSSGRTSDVPCRYGGEEFTVILPSTGVEEATEVAERFRERLAEEQWPRHEDLRVTASFGVAGENSVAAGAQSAALVEAADAALYQAKQQGRHRVERAPNSASSFRRSA